MGSIHDRETLLYDDATIAHSLQKVQNQSMAKALRKKGFPLFDDTAELVDGTRATGENAFRAGRTPATSVMTSHKIPIDSVLLNTSLEVEGGMVLDEEPDHNIPQVVYILQTTAFAN
jgi:hypothetical protein